MQKKPSQAFGFMNAAAAAAVVSGRKAYGSKVHLLNLVLYLLGLLPLTLLIINLRPTQMMGQNGTSVVVGPIPVRQVLRSTTLSECPAPLTPFPDERTHLIGLSGAEKKKEKNDFSGGHCVKTKDTGAGGGNNDCADEYSSWREGNNIK